MNTYKFKLQGLHCEACVKLVKMDLGEIPGVSEVSVDLASGEGTITADREVGVSEIEQALAGSEYKVINN